MHAVTRVVGAAVVAAVVAAVGVASALAPAPTVAALNASTLTASSCNVPVLGRWMRHQA